MNKPPRITRTQIVECNWSWCSLNEAKAYRRSLGFLAAAGDSDSSAAVSIKSMMRYHATEAIRQARLFTVSN